MTKLNKTRQKLADEFIAALKRDDLQWKKGWVTVLMQNGVSNRNYRGCNQLFLSWVASEKGYKDPRWLTFNQIADRQGKYHKGQKWTLKKGTKGCPIEFWMAYVKSLKKAMSFDIAKEMVVRGIISKKDIRPICKTTTVFNAENVEGISKYEWVENDNKKVDIINKLSENMEIPIIEKPVKCPCYILEKDEIWIPKSSSFYDNYELNSSLLHEFAHATGVEKRLNRIDNKPCKTWSKMENYAYEELVAEISSTFMSVYVDNDGRYDVSDEQLNSHKAYVNSWIKMLDSDPNILFNAIGEAQKAADYMEYMGGIKTKDEYEKTLDLVIDVNEKDIEKKTTKVKESYIEPDRNALVADSYSRGSEQIRRYER